MSTLSGTVIVSLMPPRPFSITASDATLPTTLPSITIDPLSSFVSLPPPLTTFFPPPSSRTCGLFPSPAHHPAHVENTPSAVSPSTPFTTSSPATNSTTDMTSTIITLPLSSTPSPVPQPVSLNPPSVFTTSSPVPVESTNSIQPSTSTITFPSLPSPPPSATPLPPPLLSTPSDPTSVSPAPSTSTLSSPTATPFTTIIPTSSPLSSLPPKSMPLPSAIPSSITVTKRPTQTSPNMSATSLAPNPPWPASRFAQNPRAITGLVVGLLIALAFAVTWIVLARRRRARSRQQRRHSKHAATGSDSTTGLNTAGSGRVSLDLDDPTFDHDPPELDPVLSPAVGISSMAMDPEMGERFSGMTTRPNDNLYQAVQEIPPSPTSPTTPMSPTSPTSPTVMTALMRATTAAFAPEDTENGRSLKERRGRMSVSSLQTVPMTGFAQAAAAMVSADAGGDGNGNGHESGSTSGNGNGRGSAESHRTRTDDEIGELGRTSSLSASISRVSGGRVSAVGWSPPVDIRTSASAYAGFGAEAGPSDHGRGRWSQSEGSLVAYPYTYPHPHGLGYPSIYGSGDPYGRAMSRSHASAEGRSAGGSATGSSGNEHSNGHGRHGDRASPSSSGSVGRTLQAFIGRLTRRRMSAPPAIVVPPRSSSSLQRRSGPSSPPRSPLSIHMPPPQVPNVVVNDFDGDDGSERDFLGGVSMATPGGLLRADFHLLSEQSQTSLRDDRDYSRRISRGLASPHREDVRRSGSSFSTGWENRDDGGEG